MADTTATCMNQLSHAKKSKYYENFNMMSNLQKDDKEWDDDEEYDDYDKEEGEEGAVMRFLNNPTVIMTFDGITFLSNILSIYDSIGTVDYYYFFEGQTYG